MEGLESLVKVEGSLSIYNNNLLRNYCGINNLIDLNPTIDCSISQNAAGNCFDLKAGQCEF